MVRWFKNYEQKQNSDGTWYFTIQSRDYASKTEMIDQMTELILPEVAIGIMDKIGKKIHESKGNDQDARLQNERNKEIARKG